MKDSGIKVMITTASNILVGFASGRCIHVDAWARHQSILIKLMSVQSKFPFFCIDVHLITSVSMKVRI